VIESAIGENIELKPNEIAVFQIDSDLIDHRGQRPVSALSAQTMTGLLTQPYGRGGETLELQLGADAGGFTLVPAYTFREYKVRYQIDPPAPQYVLYTKVPIPTSGLQVEVHYQFAGADNSTVLTLPTVRSLDLPSQFRFRP